MYLAHIEAMTAHHKNLINQAEHHRTVILLQHDEGFAPAKRKRQQCGQIIPYFA